MRLGESADGQDAMVERQQVSRPYVKRSLPCFRLEAEMKQDIFESRNSPWHRLGISFYFLSLLFSFSEYFSFFLVLGTSIM